MRQNREIYEYVAVYVDDLAFTVKDPKTLIKQLEYVHKFKLKGKGLLEFHCGTDFEQDPDGTLCMSSKTYIDKRLASMYHIMFGEGPNTRYHLPLEPGDHPELEIS